MKMNAEVLNETQIEKIHRIFGCEVIYEAGKQMNVSLTIVATAQCILHRFYYHNKSMRRYDAFFVSMGAFLLSTKVEENPKLLEEVVSTFYLIYRRRVNAPLNFIDTKSQTFTNWMSQLRNIEMNLLKELGFVFYDVIELPFAYLDTLLLQCQLFTASTENEMNESTVKEKTQKLLNDSFLIDLCVRYHPNEIASACVYLIQKDFRIQILNNNWWESLTLQQQDSINTIADELTSLQNTPRHQWLEPIVNKEFQTNDLYDVSNSQDQNKEENQRNELLHKIPDNNTSYENRFQQNTNDNTSTFSKFRKRQSRFDQ